MRSIIAARQIESLYHFTQADNLGSILEYGLCSRRALENYSIDFNYNDEYRYDNCKNAVCTSIEYPNYKMFFKLRMEHPEIKWCVIELDAQVLVDYECAFCWLNAGDSRSYSTDLQSRKTVEAFEELFEDRDGFPLRSETRIDRWFPTNPQAEVLVFGNISLDYIKGIYFNSLEERNMYLCDIPNNMRTMACVNRSLYFPRKDYSFW